MDRKGEAFILLGIIAVIIFGGAIIFKGLILDKEKPYYVVDNYNKTYYNLNSKNPNCNLNNIHIEEKNLIHLGGNIKIEEFNYTVNKNNICD